VLALIAGGAWLMAGPLAPDWAHRSGTVTRVTTGSSTPSPGAAPGGSR